MPSLRPEQHTPGPLQTKHATDTIGRLVSLYRVPCECGWQGVAWPTIDAARVSHVRHVERSAPTATRRMDLIHECTRVLSHGADARALLARIDGAA